MKTIFFLSFFSLSVLYAQSDSLVTIKINSNYRNSLILIDDRETGFTTPALISSIKTGSHKVTLKWNYLITGTEYAAEKIIDVKNEQDSFFVEFKAVTVGIVCNAQKTELYLDGRLKGSGSDIVIDSIIPGTYTMRIKQPFGIIAEKKVFFAPNSSDCPVECFVFGNLHLTSDELEKTPVYLNGKKTDQVIPTVFSKLLVGEYEVSVKANGKDYSKKIIVKADEDVYVRINPKQIEQEARDQKKINAGLLKNLLATKRKEDHKKTRMDSVMNELYRSKLNVFFGLNNSYLNYRYDFGGTGLDIGFGYDLPIKKFFIIQSEIHYSSRVLSYGYSDGFGQVTLESILLSTNVKKYLINSYFAFGGLSYEYLLNYKELKFSIWNPQQQLYNTIYNTKSHAFRYQFGFGADISKHFYGEIKFSNGFEKLAPKVDGFDKKLYTFSFNIGWYFYTFSR